MALALGGRAPWAGQPQVAWTTGAMRNPGDRDLKGHGLDRRSF